MRIRLRTVLLILIALVTVGSIWRASSVVEPTAQPTATATFVDGSCDAEHPGVSTFIDFGDDRADMAYCALNFNGSGWDLLTERIDVEGTSEYPTGFVCRIEGWPTAEEQDCADTPTYSEGSWVYWVADSKTNGWSMSGTGSSMRKPECGASEAWVFSKSSVSDTENADLPSASPVVFECSKN